MKINDIAASNDTAQVNTTAPQYKPSAIPASTNNPVFQKDAVSFGNVLSPYETYSAAPAAQANNAELSDTGLTQGELEKRTRVWMFDLFCYAFGETQLIPEGASVEMELNDEEIAFLRSFHSRILAIMDSEGSLNMALALADSSEELSPDEQINAIIAKYCVEPIGYDQVLSLHRELAATGLFEDWQISLIETIGHIGIRLGSYRIRQELLDTIHKSDKDYSVADLEELFLSVLENHDKYLQARRQEFYDENRRQALAAEANSEETEVEKPLPDS